MAKLVKAPNFETILRQPLDPETRNPYVFNIPNLPRETLPSATEDERVVQHGLWGKQLVFTEEKLLLRFSSFSLNRVLYLDPPKKFVLASFDQLRFKDKPPSVASKFIEEFLLAGIKLNGKTYRFFGHSNSQLKDRKAYLYECDDEKEIDEKLNRLGSFSKIMSPAKRAKRIGLLFSTIDMGVRLDPSKTEDIDDIKVGEECFSDGCGLISPNWARQLAKKKHITYLDRRYCPAVFQIRYRGYKGVLMLHPEIDKPHADPQHHVFAQFRKSMKKFSDCPDPTFGVVEHSKPYSFAYLNGDVITLLTTLGITHEILLKKQRQHFGLLSEASTDFQKAVQFLCTCGELELAEKVLYSGLDDKTIQQRIRAVQNRTLSRSKRGDDSRVRLYLEKSRFLFGVCDPYGVLREGEVHVRITTPRGGATTITNTDVMVVRNPCLHPGDILKLRVVDHRKLDHLVDCLVFSGRGKRAAPSMSSGGDLDGDKFMVVWDPEIVPKINVEPYGYPGAKEKSWRKVTRTDLARHFAQYNNGSLARVKKLYLDWVRGPQGALGQECQELNSLHSDSVDGAPIKIPPRFKDPPAFSDSQGNSLPFILDVMKEDIKAFTAGFAAELDTTGPIITLDAKTNFLEFLSSPTLPVTEYQLFLKTVAFCRVQGEDIREYWPYFDFGAFTTQEKALMWGEIEFDPELASEARNSLRRSQIISRRELQSQRLDGAYHFQRLYSTSVGKAAFWEYLQIALRDFDKKLIIIRTDERLAVGIYIPKRIEWSDEALVDDQVCVLDFLQTAVGDDLSKPHVPTKKGSRLYCDWGQFQLYERQRANTFVFMAVPPAASQQDLIVSIALQKINARVQRHIGRLNRTPVAEVEIHVVSNRDRVAHQRLDERFGHVQTEEFLPRIAPSQREYRSLDFSGDEILKDWGTALCKGDWSTITTCGEQTSLLVFHQLCEKGYQGLAASFLPLLLERGWVSSAIIAPQLTNCPLLVYPYLRRHEPTSGDVVPVLQSLVSTSNQSRGLAIGHIQRLQGLLEDITTLELIELLWLVSLSVRNLDLVHELLLTIVKEIDQDRFRSGPRAYLLSQAFFIALDRAEEADDACHCSEDGFTKKREAFSIDQPKLSDKDPHRVILQPRLDVSTGAIRPGDQIRLRASRPPTENQDSQSTPMLDAVVSYNRGREVGVDVIQNIPPFFRHAAWQILPAGSTTTSRASLEALLRLADQDENPSFIRNLICSTDINHSNLGSLGHHSPLEESLNESQRRAVQASGNPLLLCWGPPGCGKTTTIVAILMRFLLTLSEDSQILMTASTHNAVDNVLEKFLEARERLKAYFHQQVEDLNVSVLRVATDVNRVGSHLRDHTINAMVSSGGGELEDNPKLAEAKKRVAKARIIFSTCAGAGLGVLKHFDFDVVLIDEASQITEAVALIPLVKGAKRAVLVGDHVQLCATLRPRCQIHELGQSLFERQFVGPDIPGITKVMLDTQYRFPSTLAAFPSREFYEGKLKTGIADEKLLLPPSAFPWPLLKENDKFLFPNVFIHCPGVESYGGSSSKDNKEQAELVKRSLDLLLSPPSSKMADGEEKAQSVSSSGSLPKAKPVASIAILTPYKAQVKMIEGEVGEMGGAIRVSVNTVDGFQGKEADIVIFSTVRCQNSGQKELGFLDDKRRLNVAWTRAKRGRIMIGDRATLESSEIWRRAIGDAEEVKEV